jgi:hypothetical protein
MCKKKYEFALDAEIPTSTKEKKKRWSKTTI